jgi:hypothetical protein
MPIKVFISYRRDDAGHAAGRIHDRLREFGADLRFMDVDAEEVAKCDVLLALIGPNWLDVRDEEGNRRLDNPADFLRIEIATALQRNIPVIPILLDGARMPRADQLPDDLKELSVRNGIDIRHASFYPDMDKLIRSLKVPHLFEVRYLASGKTPGEPVPEWPNEVPPSEVRLGASTPPVVSPGETFVARFAAYTDANRDTVKAIIEQEAPTSQLRWLDRCRWRPGTRVSVRLECKHAKVSNPVQTFKSSASMLRSPIRSRTIS